MKPKKYITTSIAYPNANPHIGYALELVQGDFLARYYDLKGYQVYFLSGVDEHGLKIQKMADVEGVTPMEFVNQKTLVFKNLIEKLNIRINRFIRTSDSDHQDIAKCLWLQCEKNGDIYKKQYQAWYNFKEEEFIGLVDEMPNPELLGHDMKYLEKIDENNYFFRLSRYEQQIKNLIEQEKYKVLPKNRRQEILNFISAKGLQDISISREAVKLSWGIPVPNDPEQVMYVWFDALTNYLTAVSEVKDENIIPNDFWPVSVHCVGKDIQRFHAIIWTGMLLSAGVELPEELLVHGFLTSNGQKMSKSIGNVVDPITEINRVGADAVRWYLLKEVSTTGDSDYSEKRLDQIFQADLANDFGNLVSRVWTMAQKYMSGVIMGVSHNEEVVNKIQLTWQEYYSNIENREFEKSLQAVHGMMVYCNRLIEDKKPWVMAKDEKQNSALFELLYELLEIIRHISVMLTPVMPDTIHKIQTKLFPNSDQVLWQLFDRSMIWGGIQDKEILGTDQIILFPRTNL